MKPVETLVKRQQQREEFASKYRRRLVGKVWYDDGKAWTVTVTRGNPRGHIKIKYAWERAPELDAKARSLS